MSEEVYFQHDITAVGFGTIITIPEGKKFKLRTLTISHGATAGILTLFDSTDTSKPVYKVSLAAGTVLTLTNLQGIYFETVIARTLTAGFPCFITLGGIMEEG